jgi:hypothetical protein
MAREPGYCLHKPSGKAYVNLVGKVHYLGVHGTDESKERYRAFKAEVYQECRLLCPLQAGSTVAPETQKVTCVAQSVVNATLPEMTQVLRDMVCFQQLVGYRPGE